MERTCLAIHTFHIERNLHYEIVMETKFINMKETYNIISCPLKRGFQLVV